MSDWFDNKDESMNGATPPISDPPLAGTERGGTAGTPFRRCRIILPRKLPLMPPRLKTLINPSRAAITRRAAMILTDGSNTSRRDRFRLRSRRKRKKARQAC